MFEEFLDKPNDFVPKLAVAPALYYSSVSFDWYLLR